MSSSARPPTKVFVLNTDPNISDKSLCRRVVNASMEVFNSSNYQVVSTDLAKDGWLDPISAKDFAKVSDPIHINFRTEHLTSPLVKKIQDEQSKLLQSDLFIIYAPLSWFALPSHFFAWWERVVTFGKMFGPGKMYQTGSCARKRAICVIVTDKKQEEFGRDTPNGTIEEMLYPVTHGMLYPLGFKIYRTQAVFLPNPAQHEEILGKFQSAIRELEERTPITFNQPSDYSNWVLHTNEKDRKNDLEILIDKGDMTIQEATMKISTSVD
ncbi:Flavodoxin-like fold family protein [Tritrichomonas foetus]|uniref:Flavodoxin-like fold family protein n=1 Tax=Tritrichomonas foetus TaxID=1144522 RepID=A0A1J4KNK8_9EUKA|nr:Flavodoxin-like fold family protein [Tritrichomonas foetus]|eukprot:OHT12496.1 Flavodoxin-like fold family protein [Tritrichomonas foetus]